MKARRFLDSTAAAEYLAFGTVRQFHDFLYRRRKAGFPVRCHHRGRSILFTEADLDAALDVEERRASQMRRAG